MFPLWSSTSRAHLCSPYRRRPPSEDTDENETDRKIGDNFDYVFALDGDSDYDADTVWSVDAYRAGNWTRFAKCVRSVSKLLNSDAHNAQSLVRS